MNRKLLLVGIGMMLVTSCTKEPQEIIPFPQESKSVQLTEAEALRLPLLSENHRRTAETVLNFAESVVKTQSPASKASGGLIITDSVVLNVPTKGTASDAAPIYVVSRGKGQGFILVCGDNRVSPILGIIEQGDYEEGVNPGFDIMIGRLQEEVLLDISQKEALRDSVYDALRQKLGLDQGIATKAPLPDDGAPDYNVPEGFNRTEIVERDIYYENTSQYGSLLKTQWSQRWPYNTEVIKKYPDCPVGCVATAMAQIMAYYQHPKSMASTGHTYNWDAIMGGWWSSEAVSSIGYLMADLGLPQYLDMQYSPKASGAECQAKTAKVFHEFGYNLYSSLHYPFTYTHILNEVKNNRPVHICGDNGKSGNDYTGHAWVADGTLVQDCWATYYVQFYKDDQFLGEIKDGTRKKSSQNFVHHNFGWGGLHDGWYSSLAQYYINDDLNNIHSNDFNKNLAIIMGITPR